MEASELLIREQIRHTLASYNHAGDRMDLAGLAACFTAEGVLEIKGRPLLRGRAAIVEGLTATVAPDTAAGGEPRSVAPYAHHHVTNVRIDAVTAERAEAASYFVVFTPIGADHWGRYRDVLAPEDGQWLLAHRRVTTAGFAPGSYFDR